MVGMRMENFGGMVPLLSRRLLPENMATYATNAYMRGGEVRGLREPKLLTQFPNGGGDPVYYRAARLPDPDAPTVPVWVPFLSQYARIFPNPIKNDAFDRYLWVDENANGSAQPLYQNSFARIKAGNTGADAPILLGVPSPSAAPGLVVSGGSGTVETRSYVYTYVNLFGEEGPPSDAVTVSGFQNGTWDLSSLLTPAFVTTRGITYKRIYRTVSGTSATAFYFVADIPVANTTYGDVSLGSVLAQAGILLASTDWEPPEDMEGIVQMPNGFFVGWRGKDVFFSEPYRPWAWPPGYTLTTAYSIIDMGVIDQTIVALTATSPILITGVTPAAMSMSAVNYVEPCLSRNSVVQAPEGVYFASPNGLNLLSPSGILSITREVIGRDQWQKDYAANINAAASFDSQYVSHSAIGTGFVFDPRGLQSGIIGIVNYPIVRNIWTDPYTGQAHLMIDNGVYEWSNEDQPLLAASWLSKEFQFPRPMNFGAFIVNIDPRYTLIDAPTTIIDESTQPVGDPWPEESSIINYNQINGVEVNGAPAWGATPPDNPSHDPWPYWYGVASGSADYDLPDGGVCEIIIFASGAIVWRGIVESGVMYRLPSGFKADLWQVQIKSRVPVMNVQIAETPKELARV